MVRLEDLKCKDVSWRIKCRRMVDRVCSVFGSGNEKSSWSRPILERTKGWETKGHDAFVQIQRTAMAARIILEEDELAVFFEMIAEKLLTAIG